MYYHILSPKKQYPNVSNTKRKVDFKKVFMTFLNRVKNQSKKRTQLLCPICNEQMKRDGKGENQTFIGFIFPPRVIIMTTIVAQESTNALMDIR